jgi:hypothetical protein
MVFLTIAVKGGICLTGEKGRKNRGLTAVERQMGRKTKSFSPVLGFAKRPVDFFSRP